MQKDNVTSVDFGARIARSIAAASEESNALKGGGGGGTSGGMETRVAKLENDLNGFRLETAKAFGEIKATLATIDERTKHLPTKWEAFLITAAVVGFVGTAIGIAVRFVP